MADDSMLEMARTMLGGGWVLFFLVSVVVAAFAFGILSYGEVGQGSCSLDSGFSCHDFLLDGTGNLLLDVSYNGAKDVEVTRVGCQSSDGISAAVDLSQRVVVRAGTHVPVVWPGSPDALACCLPGRDCRINVTLQYSQLGSYVGRTAHGEIDWNGPG
jgi:hypothetical protein